MNKKISTILILGLALALSAFVLHKPVQQAGDIVEYYGVTQSLANHGGISLTQIDQKNLETVLHPAYFSDPQYYVTGRDGARWPVHFFFYSLLLIPIRLGLQLFSAPELYTLSLTNILILTVTALFVVHNFLQHNRSRMLFLILFYLSPLLFFITWPGADLLYICLLLISVFYFFEKNYFKAALFASVASWQSQPLAIIAVFMTLYYVEIAFRQRGRNKKSVLQILISSFYLLILIALPYLYNLYAFGVLTPWTRFENGWTFINGFGMQNIRISKLFEQFFDPNIGLFWYAPLLGLLVLYILVRFVQKLSLPTSEVVRHNFHKIVLFGVFVCTAFFYQTNPAWHYGTAGYGPTRHILFFIPFLIVWILSSWLALPLKAQQRGVQDQSKDSGVTRLSGLHRMTLALLVIIQLYALSLNGFVTPNFEHTLHNSPYAAFILNTMPRLYNPTPELFVDRTSHTDLDHPTSAVYKYNGVCKKAYILQTDAQLLINECRNIPENILEKVDNELLRKTNYKRTVKTTEATLWPDTKSCSDEYVVDMQHPYVCLKSIDDVVRETGITDKSRIATIKEFPARGVWKIKRGTATTFTIPPGYIINHSALTGSYVNF